MAAGVAHLRHAVAYASGSVAQQADGLPSGSVATAIRPLPDRLTWSITVLTLRGDRIAGITSFLGPEHFAAFGLPASLP